MLAASGPVSSPREAGAAGQGRATTQLTLVERVDICRNTKPTCAPIQQSTHFPILFTVKQKYDAVFVPPPYVLYFKQAHGNPFGTTGINVQKRMRPMWACALT